MPDTNTQGVALDPKGLEAATKAYNKFECGSDVDHVRSIIRAYLSAAQEGREAVAWLTEGYGYKRVFLEREAAEKLARGGDGTVLPLYTHPAPAQLAAQVVDDLERLREAANRKKVGQLYLARGTSPRAIINHTIRALDLSMMRHDMIENLKAGRVKPALASPTDADAAVVTGPSAADPHNLDPIQTRLLERGLKSKWIWLSDDAGTHDGEVCALGELHRAGLVEYTEDTLPPGPPTMRPMEIAEAGRAALTAAKAGEDGRHG